MSISHESWDIGTVRALQVSAAPGVGATQLRFTLEWTLHSKRENDYSVFGTYVRVAVAPEGTTDFLYLGHAVPEVAWTDEARPHVSRGQPLMYHLTLHADQLLALEHTRQQRGLIFALDVRGNSHGPAGIRSFDEALRLNISLSDWIDVLRQAKASEILLVGVQVPCEPRMAELTAASELVRRAHGFLLRGENDAAVGECRRALESVWKLGKLAESARAARKALSGTMDDRKAMSKKDRELALGEALINFTHPAHHVDDDGDAEIFSRHDAALTVVTTAALVSSLTRLFEY